MHRRPRLSGAAASGCAVLLAALSAGCSGPSPAAAPLASGAACATALALLPARVLDQSRSGSSGSAGPAGTAAWGDPPIVLRCGLAELGPSRLLCQSVNGVDWVVDPTADPLVFTTFGRSPAVEVTVPTSYGRQNASGALVDLGQVAAALPKTSRRCSG